MNEYDQARFPPGTIHRYRQSAVRGHSAAMAYIDTFEIELEAPGKRAEPRWPQAALTAASAVDSITVFLAHESDHRAQGKGRAVASNHHGVEIQVPIRCPLRWRCRTAVREMPENYI